MGRRHQQQQQHDEEMSIGNASIPLSQSSSAHSFTPNFSIDWDEIDSIADDSLSLSSMTSASSHSRQRRNSSKSRSSNNNMIRMESDSAIHVSLKGLRPRRHGYFQQRDSKRRRGEYCIIKFLKRVLWVRVFVLTLCTLAFFSGFSVRRAGLMLRELSVSRDVAAYVSNDRELKSMMYRWKAPYKNRQWPVSVRDEEDNFELIAHPAADKVTLYVPKFYLSNHDGQMETFGDGMLLTRNIADMVGTTTAKGLKASKDVVSVRTIYIGIASYRDWHCRYTVESALTRARHPERIRIGVVHQLEADQDVACDSPIVPCKDKPDQSLCQRRDQVDVYEMEATLAVGPTFARHVVNRMYRGEYYALQIDSHVSFVQDWDVDVIHQFENTGNDMAILSTYLDDSSGSIDETTGRSLRVARRVVCGATYEGSGRDRRLRPDTDHQPLALSPVHGMPQLQPFLSTGFLFSRGHFILQVPYDPKLPMILRSDEEISMALRAFSHGYDIYTPERNVCFDSSRAEPANKKSFLQHAHLYDGYEKKSYSRLTFLTGLIDDPDTLESKISQNESIMFGLGKVRDVVKFFTIFGIHSRERITERNLCDFVATGRMHQLFHSHIREDGMGIDYSVIHFRFHELQNNHENG